MSINPELKASIAAAKETGVCWMHLSNLLLIISYPDPIAKYLLTRSCGCEDELENTVPVCGHCLDVTRKATLEEQEKGGPICTVCGQPVVLNEPQLITRESEASCGVSLTMEGQTTCHCELPIYPLHDTHECAYYGCRSQWRYSDDEHPRIIAVRAPHTGRGGVTQHFHDQWVAMVNSSG